MTGAIFVTGWWFDTMVTISINGETIGVQPRARLNLGSQESQIREWVPLTKIPIPIGIALHSAWTRCNVQLKEIDELEALIDNAPTDLEDQ